MQPVSKQRLGKDTSKMRVIYSSIEDSEVVFVLERNNAGLKKLSSFVWTHK
jgi:hypothetical protein